LIGLRAESERFVVLLANPSRGLYFMDGLLTKREYVPFWCNQNGIRSRVDDCYLRGLRLFGETHRPRMSLVVCNETVERVVDGIRIVPWRQFFRKLWAGRILS